MIDAGLTAQFDQASKLVAALEALRARGYVQLDAFSPYRLAEAESVILPKRSRLPRVIFLLAVVGAISAFTVQWYCNVISYNLNVGGRPSFAVLSFVPITFEGMVLTAGVSTLLLLLYVLGLPHLSHPIFDVPGFELATVDKFFVAVGRDDAHFDSDKTTRELMELGATRVTPFGEAP